MRSLLFAVAIFVNFPTLASSLLEQMALEEKVGQLLLTHFMGEVVNADAQFLIQEAHVGGFIYYNWANGLKSPYQVRHLSHQLQSLNLKTRIPIPLLIAVDQEGGQVIRLTDGFTIFPGNRALTMAGNCAWAEESALDMGIELRAVGINMNLCPVVDVNSNPYNPIIGIRSLSDNPETVVKFGKSLLEGYRKAGIVTCLKHFPGHGDVSLDSHLQLPIVHRSLEELKKVELLPFAQLAQFCDTIMTGHLLVPALDDQKCATLSPKVLGYLRKEIGFKGVIVADSLVMKGLLEQCSSVDEAAIQAIEAGCDLLILGGKNLNEKETSRELTPLDVKCVHHAIVKAVQSGRIAEEKIDESVLKILALKERYATLDPLETITFNQSEHSQLAKKISAAAIRNVGEARFFIPPLSQKEIAIFAPDNLKDSLCQASIPFEKESTTYLFSESNPSEKEKEEAKLEASKADLLFLCSSNAWKYPKQEEFLQSLIETEKPAVLLVLCDPVDAQLFPKASLILTTFSPTPPSLSAAFEMIKRKSEGLSLNISENQAHHIADKIWYNECGGKVEYLTHWNRGENFGSFGIGHFIWYPAHQKGPYEETFPEFLLFLEEHHVEIPEWLKRAEGCPWNTRESFYQNKNSAQMNSLRQFLMDTKQFQALFIAKRFEKHLPLILANLPPGTTENTLEVFYKLANHTHGIYPLVDYFNFKGAGTSIQETYQGEGWGLLQVLQLISPLSQNIILDFIEAAKKVLVRRVENSPNPEQEKKWLKGWMKRIETYQTP